MKSIISDYLKNHNASSLEEKDFFSSRKSLEEAISYAALAKDSEGKFSHQYRVTNEALKGSQMVLLQSINSISLCKTFHELFKLVELLIGPIHGIGPLTTYDTALRIGFKLKLYPEFVYLHAGTKEGAKKLGLSTKKPYLEISEIPKPFHELEPDQIESIFCIYKDKFNTNHGVRLPRPRC